MNRIVCIGLMFVMCAGCKRLHGGKISTPEAAKLSFVNPAASKIDATGLRALKRYLAASPQWEVLKDKGTTYAIRMEKEEGLYTPTLNGYYSGHDKNNVYRQRRLIVSFGKPYGGEYDNVTRAKVGAANVPVIIEGEDTGQPSHSSYVIVEGRGLFVEFYEQDPGVERVWTRTAYEDVSKMLSDVLKHQQVILSSGLMPKTSPYITPTASKPRFDVLNGMQGGIFILRADINPGKPGEVFVKVFDAKSGKQLSKSETYKRSLRVVGWAPRSTMYFPYAAEIVVYEGDWSSKYKARFELWFRDTNGNDTKLMQHTRFINGWQR